MGDPIQGEGKGEGDAEREKPVGYVMNSSYIAMSYAGHLAKIDQTSDIEGKNQVHV